MPYGRKFNKKSGKWSLDEKKVELIRWAANEILNGRGTVEVSNILKQKHGLPLSRNYLVKVLTERCGDSYTINFRKGKDPVTFKIPRILNEQTIALLKERFKRNQQFNRTDIKKNKPLLNEFTRCARCGRAVQGYIDTKTYKGRTTKYSRYRQGELTFFIHGAYMLYEPKQVGKRIRVGTSFKQSKYLDGTDAPYAGLLINRRIFDNKTLTLSRG